MHERLIDGVAAGDVRRPASVDAAAGFRLIAAPAASVARRLGAAGGNAWGSGGQPLRALPRRGRDARRPPPLRADGAVLPGAGGLLSIPSSDSSPRSVWEAMACGCPVVLPDLPLG
jgi:hypothetical protein